jgi:hypothetical protein
VWRLGLHDAPETHEANDGIDALDGNDALRAPA